jgi:hypothetical protein
VIAIGYLQLLVAGRWYSLCTLVSSTNKTDQHNITEILLKVALNTIKPNLFSFFVRWVGIIGVYHHFQQFFSNTVNAKFNGGGLPRQFNGGGLARQFNEGGLPRQFNGGGLPEHFNLTN